MNLVLAAVILCADPARRASLLPSCLSSVDYTIIRKNGRVGTRDGDCCLSLLLAARGVLYPLLLDVLLDLGLSSLLLGLLGNLLRLSRKHAKQARNT